LAYCPIQSSAAGKYILLVSSEYPRYFSENLPDFGFITAIVVEAYKRAGYKTDIQFRPWARALKAAKEGPSDGMFALWYRREREA
jgi:polar amino acid transport system substrate-binding protein